MKRVARIIRGREQQVAANDRARRVTRRAAERAVFEQLEGRRLMSSALLVTNTQDAGAGSLRQAILDANLDPGSTITFNIPQADHAHPVAQTISPTSDLPVITAAVTIDATTEFGYAGSPMVQITAPSGAASSRSGLTLQATATVEGLAISGWGSFGIEVLAGADGSVIRNDFIGTDSSGTVANPNQTDGIDINANNVIVTNDVISGNFGSGVLFNAVHGGSVTASKIGTDVTGEIAIGNSSAGVQLNGSDSVVIGGTAADMNLISGNIGNAVYFSGATTSTIADNFIGTDFNGVAALGNYNGVELDSASANNTISGNVISGNGGGGINSNNNASEPNVISNNYVGTNAAGTAAVPNVGDGITLGSAGTTVTGNLVSGNGGIGIVLHDGSLVTGNYIGTDASGLNALGNVGDGVYIFSSGNTLSGNTIAYNGDTGIAIYSGAGNSIRQNSILGNTHPGIDLGDFEAPTLNDTQGHDPSSPNMYQDYPVITSATGVAGGVTFTGTVFGPASTTLTVDFYANSTSGDGQGQTWLGSTSVTTDASGNGSINTTLDTTSLPASMTYFSSTATDAAGNTSEFAPTQALPASAAQPTSSTTVSSSLNPAALGQMVTLSATVASTTSSSTAPTGTVTFYDGSTPLGNAVTISNGIASMTVSSLTLGGHTITATYTSDDGFASSTSLPLSQTINADQSQVALTSSANPTVFGQAVTLTATVSSFGFNNGTPTGMVTLFDGGSQLGNPALIDANGMATWTFAGLPVGHHSLTVQYGGVADYSASTSGALDQVVNPAATSVTVGSSMDPSTYGQSVTFTATVSVTAPGAAMPSGNVTFMDGTNSLGTGTLSNGVATLTTSALSVGDHVITAMYLGDANTSSSTSLALTQTVDAVGSSATLTSNVDPSVFGQSVTFTATLTSAGGTPTGSVTLMEGATPLGSATLDSTGKATWTFSNLSVGDHYLMVSYAGDGTFQSTVSPTYDQTVQKAGTATTITSLLAPTTYGQSVTFTAQVAVIGAGAGTPDGTVAFMDGAAQIGTGTLDANGFASFTTSSLAPGNHSITAHYVGAQNFLPSVSAAVNQAVGLDASETVLKSSADPSVYGQDVMITATVMDLSLTSYTPTGSVTFFDGSKTLGTMTLDTTGMAQITLSSLSVGSHTITASYSGDGYVSGDMSAQLAQTVTRAMSGTTLASSASPSVFGQNVSLTATVSGTPGVPSGSVVFYDGTTQLGQANVDASGHATLPVSTFAVGDHTITAHYVGDTNFMPSSSAAIDQMVNKAGTTTAVTSSASPSTVGQMVTFTARVSVLAPGQAALGGAVAFMDGSIVVGMGTLSNGVATFSTSGLSGGDHSITAAYAGDAHTAASSASLTQTVNALATISGHVYKDLTGDGLTGDDTAMGGVTVQLFRDMNGNGTLDGNDTLAATATSNASGAYSFTNLKPGEYFAQEVLPGGYVRTAPLVGTYYTISANTGTASTSNDFDNFQNCNCKSDLSSYYFTDGCHRLSDLRNNTHQGDTVSVTFTIKPGQSDSFYLVVYSAPGSTFDASTASQQKVNQVSGGSFSAGTHTLSVHLPKSDYQVDFVCGSVITHFGPAGSNVFYTPQGRLISADNE